MRQLWSIRGAVMVGAWGSYGRYVGLLWSIRGAVMVDTWGGYGRYVGQLWSIRETVMVDTWGSYGRYVGRLLEVQGGTLPPPLNAYISLEMNILRFGDLWPRGILWYGLQRMSPILLWNTPIGSPFRGVPEP